MIANFVVSLGLIIGASIMFFYLFLDSVLDMSISSIFFAHTQAIIGDIIQIK
jgi:hypothetical protein